MVQFITDPKNQPQFENVELDVNLENGKWRTPVSCISQSRGAAAPSRHRRDSSSSEKTMGGLWSKFEAILTETVPSAQADAAARRVHAAGGDVLCS